MERERDRPPRNDGMMMMSSGAATLTQDACEKCYRHGRLEISITGREKLCKSCMIEQFEYYKKQRVQYCGEIEKLAEFYRRKIESLNPVIQSNLQQINQVADQIEESYSAALNLLNKQKIELMALLNDCKKDNTRFTDFKNQLNVVLGNMEAFKDPSQNLYEDNVIKSLVNKFEQSLQVSQTIERTYQSLINQPVRYVERYERGPSLAPNKKYLGQVFIMDSASGASLPTVPVPAAAASASATAPAATAPSVGSAVAGNARMSSGGATNPTTSRSIKDTNDDLRHSNAALQHMALTEREHNYEKWLKRTSETPYMVAQFDKEPSFVVAYRNLVFVVNPRSELTMITISSSDELQVRETYQIPLPNIRSIAVNANYFAISYSDLDKGTMKRNNYKKHGINLYERTSDFVDFNLERKFELDTGEFIYPVGIALDSDFIYVCDKGLKAVIKMDIMRGTTVARVDFPKGYPYKLAVNRDFLVVTDPAQHLLNVYDARTLRFVRNLCVEQPKAKNGPFSVYLTDDNTIFFKNYADSQLTIVDINLNKHMVFSQISTSIEGFTVAECFNNHKVLVIGSTIKNKDYRLITYFIN